MADKKFKIITKSDNFIYFVTMCEENADWHFNVGLKSTANFILGITAKSLNTKFQDFM